MEWSTNFGLMRMHDHHVALGVRTLKEQGITFMISVVRGGFEIQIHIPEYIVSWTVTNLISSGDLSSKVYCIPQSLPPLWITSRIVLGDPLFQPGSAPQMYFPLDQSLPTTISTLYHSVTWPSVGNFHQEYSIPPHL